MRNYRKDRIPLDEFLAVVAEYPGIKTPAMATTMNVHWQTAHNALRDLEAQGLIESYRKGRGISYCLAGKRPRQKVDVERNLVTTMLCNRWTKNLFAEEAGSETILREG